jgi:regulator of RNase E activity RraA
MSQLRDGAVTDALSFLRSTPSGSVTDALTRLGVRGNMVNIRPARGFEDCRLVGPALTVEIKPKRRNGPRGLTPYDIYYQSAPGKVVVIAGLGLDLALTGDNQAHTASVRGMLGLVIDGGARDVAGIRKLQLPLFYTGAQTKLSHDTHEISAFDVPVVAGGVLVNPGDIIVADEDGVVVIPKNLLEEVVEHIKSVERIEEQLGEAIAKGAPLTEIRTLIAEKRAPVKAS